MFGLFCWCWLLKNLKLFKMGTCNWLSATFIYVQHRALGHRVMDANRHKWQRFIQLVVRTLIQILTLMDQQVSFSTGKENFSTWFPVFLLIFFTQYDYSIRIDKIILITLLYLDVLFFGHGCPIQISLCTPCSIKSGPLYIFTVS